VEEQAAAKATVRATAEATAKARAEDILKVLDAPHLDPADEHRKQVTACTDIARLDRWFDRALTAATVADVFSAEN
jgi:hypothetical protein